MSNSFIEAKNHLEIAMNEAISYITYFLSKCNEKSFFIKPIKIAVDYEITTIKLDENNNLHGVTNKGIMIPIYNYYNIDKIYLIVEYLHNIEDLFGN